MCGTGMWEWSSRSHESAAVQVTETDLSQWSSHCKASVFDIKRSHVHQQKTHSGYWILVKNTQKM